MKWETGIFPNNQQTDFIYVHICIHMFEYMPIKRESTTNESTRGEWTQSKSNTVHKIYKDTSPTSTAIAAPPGRQTTVKRGEVVKLSAVRFDSKRSPWSCEFQFSQFYFTRSSYAQAFFRPIFDRFFNVAPANKSQLSHKSFWVK